MGFFDNLFGKKTITADNGGNVNLSPEQFLATDYVKNIAAKYKKDAILLLPHAAGESVSSLQSKFGGQPNFNGFEEYPCCDSCEIPLNFVLQLYKRDFPGHYFPENKNLFQLFRCPNDYCPEAYSDAFNADHKMFVYYFEDNEAQSKHIDTPQLNQDGLEEPVPDCILNPKSVSDYPVSWDFNNVTNDIESIYGEDLADYFTDEFFAAQRTKTGGYPSFIQSPVYPMCSCDKTKEFFFQLSSDDTEENAENPAAENCPPHNITIGDMGNIYFYVCKSCGEGSIESYWDCY